MLQPPLTHISRKARIWPEFSKDTVSLPNPPTPPSSPLPTMFISMLFSALGIVVLELVISRVGGGGSLASALPFAALSGIMAISAVVSFIIQSIIARRRTRYLLNAYQKRLAEIEKQLQALQWQEGQARIEMDTPFVLPSSALPAYEQLAIIPLIQRPLNDTNVSLWARQQSDPDFLQVRVGMGTREASFKIRGTQFENKIALPNKLDICNEYAHAIMEKYQSLHAPVTVKLDSSSPVMLVGSQQRLTQARELARAMVSQVVYHHSPEDVRIILLAPHSQEQAWRWTRILPHTIMYDPHQSGDSPLENTNVHAVAIGTEPIKNLLPFISRELSRRELLLGDVRQSTKKALLPHLLIVIDYFDTIQDLDQPTRSVPAVSAEQTMPLRHRSRLSISPLKRPELTLALSRNQLLGVSVLGICATAADVPTPGGVMIDLDVAEPHQALLASSSGTPPQALIRTLQPDPPPTKACDLLDSAPIDALEHFAMQMHPLHASTTKSLELRTQVDLRMLFEPLLEIEQYDPGERWNDPAFHMSHPIKGEVPNMRIPIGLKIGDEVQYLDFIKDGPHGLLIGQTGSGKSELLQTVITSLAVAYSPSEVNFLLIDYKAGLALEPFRHLPHTVGFLSNVSSPALIQRFIIMLKAEAMRREVRIKTEKNMPRLIIIIDEFAEMAKRTEAVLDELFTITRVGREIGMHLLLAAQRPEGVIGNKVRDYVQYRLCLRCASPEDSREVLRRVDAANLPASIPGRGYLLHGDNQLDLFQAGRVAIPIPRSTGNTGSQFRLLSSPGQVTPPATTTFLLAEEIVAKITMTHSREEARKDGIIFWPDPLPTPVANQVADPLTLFTDEPVSENKSPLLAPEPEEKTHEHETIIPMTAFEVAKLRKKHQPKPSMQIPLGLIDKPEAQLRETFLVDLHGTAGALSGGPLLIAGTQHSGKATALETLLFWLTTRYTPQQLRCAVIDPLQELDFFQDLPHFRIDDETSLWTDGSTDAKITSIAEHLTKILARRRDNALVQRWDENTLGNLWEQGIEIPQILLIVSHYHSFADRAVAAAALKKLAIAMVEARPLGAYLVVTSTEISGRYLPADLAGKFSTKIGLFLNEQQRSEMFGRTPIVPDPVPGRGLALTPDRSVHQVQLALPISGATESGRRERLKQQLMSVNGLD